MSSDLPGGPHYRAGGIGAGEEAFHLPDGWRESSSITYAVLAAVAAITGDEPADLDPLSDIVDPDALDNLFESSTDEPKTKASLSFPYNDCLVTIYSDGRLVINPPPA